MGYYLVIASANASGVELELYTNPKLPSSFTVAVIVYVVQLVLLLHFKSPIVIAASVNASAPDPLASAVKDADVPTSNVTVSPFTNGFLASGSAAYT